MRAWLPVPGTTTGRLTEAALELFGAQGFDATSVGEIASRAGVTTGSLYHHFGSKSGLYRLVRGDVGRRLLDRIEGAFSVKPQAPDHAVQALLVGHDYLVSAGYNLLLGDDLSLIDGSARNDSASHGSASNDDALSVAVRGWITADEPLDAMVCAAWRTALVAATRPSAAQQSRRALRTLLEAARSAGHEPPGDGPRPTRTENRSAGRS